MLLEIAKIPTSTFYYSRHKTSFEERNKKIIDIVEQEFTKYKKIYGVRRLKIAVKKDYGLNINKKKIHKIMKLKNLLVKVRIGKYNSYRGTIGLIAPNLLKRNFYSSKPYKKLTTDVTEFRFSWGKVYLQCILDMYNSEILSYEISNKIDYDPTDRMLKKLFRKYKKELSGAILHTDQGWQYQCARYVETIKKYNLVRSMSEKGNCLDNAIIENFFGRLKVEMYYGNEFKYLNFESFKNAVEKYINFYNEKRIKTTLEMSPVEYKKVNFNKNL